jgi:multisubunit Na+/H+ antiporter MnhB subunit
MNGVSQTFLIYSSFVVIVPFLVAVVRFKKMDQVWRALALLIFFDFLAEAIGHVLYFLKISNHFLWPIFITIEFTLLARIYQSEFRKMAIGRFIPIVTLLFITYVIADWLMAPDGDLSAIPHFTEGVLILLLVMCYYYKNLSSLLETRLEHQPMFWLSTGLFIYFSANSVIFIFSNYIQMLSLQFFNLIWFTHAIFNILLYIFYTLTVCLIPKKLNYNV